MTDSISKIRTGKDEADTIAAVSTGRTAAGIGIVRISGPDSLSVARRVFRAAGSRDLSEAPQRTALLGYVYDGSEPVDQVLATYFRGPHSYTGEDTVELSGHGGPYVLQRMLETVLAAGARPAEPGEFSRRAFLNGRMDLSQAEAVMELIEAKNEAARRSAVATLQGHARREITKLRRRLLHETAWIEASLDDPDHLPLEGAPERVGAVSREVQQELHRLIRSGRYGRMMTDGVDVALIGRPNVGKSSLLNALLGEDRAIVTDVAGTTRDIVTGQIRCGEMHLNLIDTAGIRDSADPVEQIGVDRARRAAQDAFLTLLIVDASQPLTPEDTALWEETRGRRVLIVKNKCDLPAAAPAAVRPFAEADVPGSARPFAKAGSPEAEKPLVKADSPGPETVAVSARTGEGIDALLERIAGIVAAQAPEDRDEWFLSRERQLRQLEEAAESLSRLDATIDAGMPEDLYTIDLMDACEHLGRITGEVSREDLADEIFSSFCMGK